MSVAWFPHRPLCLVWRCSLLTLPTCSLFSAHIYPWCFLLFYEVKIILNQSPNLSVQLSSVTVMSESLQQHVLQRAGPPCPSLTPRVYSNSCPLSRWCHPTISSPVIPFSSCLQFFPESFPIPQLKSFNFSALSFLYSKTLTSIHDHWKNHRLD